MKEESNLNLALKNIFDNSTKKELSYNEIISAISETNAKLKEVESHSINFNSWIKKELDENQKFGFVAFDFRNKEYFIDSNVQKLLELEKNQYSPFSFLKIILSHLKDTSNLILDLQKARNQNLSIIKELKLIFKINSEVKYISVNGKYNYNSNNKPINFFCSIVEETERKKDEKFQNLINSVAEDAKHAIVITEAEPLSSPGPKILYVNKAFTILTGYSPEESIGISPRFLQGEETDAESLKQLKQDLMKWEPCKAEVLNYKKNGEKFWVELDIVPVKNPDGYVTHWISIQKEITEIKFSKFELTESENKYKALINDSFDLIQTISEKGEILFVNNAWKTILGYADEDLVNLNIFDIIVADCVPKCLVDFEKIKQGNTIFDIKTKYKSKTGEIIHLNGKSTPRIVNGKILGAQGYFKDVSRVIEIEKENKDIQHTLSKVQEIAQIGEFKYNLSTKAFLISDEILNILGIQKNSLFKFENWLSLIHPDDLVLIKNIFYSAQKTQSIFKAEFRIIHNISKEIIWIKSKAEFRNDIENKCIIFQGSIKNNTVNKTLNNKLIDAKENIEFIFSSLEEVLFKLDVKNQKITSITDNCDKILGYSKEDFLDDYLLPFKIIHPEDLQNFEEDRIKLFKGEEIRSEYRIINLKGETKKVKYYGKPKLNQKNELVTLDILVKDITKSKNSEFELNYALKQLDDYKKAMDQSAIVSITDEKGSIIYVNEKFCEISQYSVEECLYKDHNILNSKYHPKEFFADMMKTISSGKNWKGEIRNKAKDGSFYWVDTTIIPFLENGKPYQYISIRFDITEKIKMSSNIEFQKTFYETILNEIPADIVVFDKHHNYLFINPTAVNNEEVRNFLIGKNDYDYCKFRNLDFAIADERRQVFLNTIESRTGLTFEEKKIEQEGNTSYKLRKFYPMFDKNNECQYVIGFGMDISDIRNQENLISESLKEKEILLGEIHHRVKNNLAIIDGLIELKKFHIKDLNSLETLSEVQMRIKIIALVHEKLYKSEQFSNIKFKDYIQELANYYKQIFDKKDGNTVQFKLDCDDLKLEISKSITFGLLLNELIANSLKYAVIDHKATIYISIKLNEENILFTFRDRGPGLPEEVKNGEKFGFGYKLIKTFLKQLKGELTHNESQHFDIQVKLNRDIILK